MTPNLEVLALQLLRPGSDLARDFLHSWSSMALVTTFMIEPLLQWLYPAARWKANAAA
jgi:hypothetical protein